MYLCCGHVSLLWSFEIVEVVEIVVVEVQRIAVSGTAGRMKIGAVVVVVAVVVYRWRRCHCR